VKFILRRKFQCDALPHTARKKTGITYCLQSETLHLCKHVIFVSTPTDFYSCLVNDLMIFLFHALYSIRKMATNNHKTITAYMEAL